MRRISLILIAVCFALGAAGCGKKPDRVLAPQGEENDRFPRTYPST
jgi:hypothetical protein